VTLALSYLASERFAIILDWSDANVKTRVRMRRLSATQAIPQAAQRLPRFRWCATASSTTTAANEGFYKPTAPNLAVSRWLFGCAGMVAGVICIGGVTRLTESGLSIVKWKPISGVVPPLSQEAWEAEFDEYKKFPEFMQRPDMTLSDFKYIFFWEWAHRVLARSLGIAFGVPALYFGGKRYFRGHRLFKAGLGGLFFLGGCQGALGWYMVKSGLDMKLLDERKKATVSAYRLASHLTLAFTIYSGMLIMAFSLRYPNARLTYASIPRKSMVPFKALAHSTAGMMFITAVSGAFVAGLDAGLLYNNTFPLMGEGIFPPWHDLTLIQPLYKNLFENGTAAQTWHRVNAGLTTLLCVAMNIQARRAGVMAFPLLATAVNRVNLALAVQVTLGFATLLSYVDVPVAASHQAGSVLLLTMLLHLSVMLGSRGTILA
jgi:cytochrome c oxidase assembly protein subunit 15